MRNSQSKIGYKPKKNDTVLITLKLRNKDKPTVLICLSDYILLSKNKMNQYPINQ